MTDAYLCDGVRTPIGRHGGALAGARIVLTAARQLAAIQGRYALATMCIGVGQGIALLVERV